MLRGKQRHVSKNEEKKYMRGYVPDNFRNLHPVEIALNLWNAAAAGGWGDKDDENGCDDC